jgi:methylenetetrahydrofolate dehydrogenase (NADP+)/methenyltetrahydrofolate cyclohydrolase
MPEAGVIDGKRVAQRLQDRVAREVFYIKSSQRLVPALAVVLVGNNPASQVYVRSKAKKAKEVGLRAIDCVLPQAATEQQVTELVGKLNDDGTIHGILVQLPLPMHVRTDHVLRGIKPSKDVDGFHPLNAGYLALGQTDMGFIPCTPLGCLMLLKSHVGDLTGKNAIVLGRSNIVGKPMAQLLLNANCTVTTAHSKTVDLAEQCRRADIVVAAIGKPEFVKADWIKSGATVIDVGINRVEVPGVNPRLVGDVAFEDAKRVAGRITPVPGGVGPMTIACLLANTVTAACRANGLECPNWLAGMDDVAAPIMPAFARVP